MADHGFGPPRRRSRSRSRSRGRSRGRSPDRLHGPHFLQLVGAAAAARESPEPDPEPACPADLTTVSALLPSLICLPPERRARAFLWCINRATERDLLSLSIALPEAIEHIERLLEAWKEVQSAAAAAVEASEGLT